MLAYEIYYVGIITFVYKMCLFRPHNAQVHSAFCPRNESSVFLSGEASTYFLNLRLFPLPELFGRKVLFMHSSSYANAVQNAVHNNNFTYYGRTV